MKFKKWLVLFALLTSVVFAQAAEVVGVKIDDVAVVDGTPLVLNGAGVRSRVFIKVYVAALYLPQKNAQAGSILQMTAPRRVVLRMMRGLDAQTLSEALEDGVRNNSAASDFAAIKPSLEDFLGQMRKLGKLNEADVVVMDLQGNGVRVAVNAKPVAQIASAAMSSTLLRIWLGENPVDPALKVALLGG